jgi:hypothetical protein
MLGLAVVNSASRRCPVGSPKYNEDDEYQTRKMEEDGDL